MSTETEYIEQAQRQRPAGTDGRWSLAGALATAGIASICCLGTLVLVALGVGGALAGSLAAFEPYRPIFILLTVALLSLAFYRAYRAPTAEACATDGQCAVPRAARINRIALWLLTPLILLLLTSPYLAPRLLATQPPPAVGGAGLEQATIQIQGMTCPTCTASVQQALLRVDGVKAANVSYDPPQAVVTYDPRKVSTEELTTATADVGYPSTFQPQRNE